MASDGLKGPGEGPKLDGLSRLPPSTTLYD